MVFFFPELSNCFVTVKKKNHHYLGLDSSFHYFQSEYFSQLSVISVKITCYILKIYRLINLSLASVNFLPTNPAQEGPTKHNVKVDISGVKQHRDKRGEKSFIIPKGPQCCHAWYLELQLCKCIAWHKKTTATWCCFKNSQFESGMQLSFLIKWGHSPRGYK